MRGRRHIQFFGHRNSGPVPSGGYGIHRVKAEEDREGWSLAMAVPHGGRLGPRRFLRDQNRCRSVRIFCTDRIALRQVCDRSLEIPVRRHPTRRDQRGPLPVWLRLRFNPARPLVALPAGECPLYVRAIVILFAAANGKCGNSPRLLLPAFNSRNGACGHSSQCPAPRT